VGRGRSMVTTQRIIDVHRLEVKGKERRNISEASTTYHREEAYLHKYKPFD
jgi:hypothetical protein